MTNSIALVLPLEYFKKPVITGFLEQKTATAKGVGWDNWREGSNPSFSATNARRSDKFTMTGNFCAIFA